MTPLIIRFIKQHLIKNVVFFHIIYRGEKVRETYTVKAGDTLYGISNQFGVSVTELANLNNIYGSNLSIGQVLNIPSKQNTNPDTMFMYTYCTEGPSV